MTQQIRISQFVLTWGPGSILETIRGSRIIPLPDQGLFIPNRLNPANFEISDPRASRVLLGGNRIFRLPSNAELGLPVGRPLYRTAKFPRWQLCYNLTRHTFRGRRNFAVLFNGNSHGVCPVCKSNNVCGPVRFVIACPAGHLDDLNWYYAVHSASTSCSAGWYMWIEEGPSLSAITIRCPECGRSTNMHRIYNRHWQCTGRFPEKGDPRETCTRQAVVIQKQASNLRIPEIRTLFSVDLCTPLHLMLQQRELYAALSAHPPENEDEFRKMLENLKNANMVSASTAEEILTYSWNEIQQAIREVMRIPGDTYEDLVEDEFRTFIVGSRTGIPPQRRSGGREPVIIEVDANRVRSIISENFRFRVVPVLKLRTVIVQIGYRREVDTSTPADLVDISFSDNTNPLVRWYPGVEFFGEGIFIMLDTDEGWHPPLSDESTTRWFEARGYDYPGSLFRDPVKRKELHPGFVWWHTLSHALIRAVSAEAGYPAASIRERVYLEIDEQNTRFRGGILLYSVQPGGEGTLGGLVGLIPHFEKIFKTALSMLESCSGDPLCIENVFSPGKYCGAACYGCMFLSETSCEHRNMWLDRRVVLENRP